MRTEAERKLAECRAELRRLPEPPNVDATVEILRLIMAFCQDLNNTVYGGSGVNFGNVHDVPMRGGNIDDLGASTAFIRNNRAKYEQFKKRIRATAPDFRPFENHEEYRQPLYDNVRDTGTTRDLNEVRLIIKEYKNFSPW